MAKIHAFNFGEGGTCRVILHTAMPPGNNLVGNSWKDIWIAAGYNQTSLTEGNGIGQITPSEKADVEAGNIIEISSIVPSNIIKQGPIAVNAYVDEVITSMKSKLSSEYAYYGWTNG
jgi:hypothetical protein